MTYCCPQYLSYERTKTSGRGAVKITAETESPEMEAALVHVYDEGVDVVLHVKGKL